MPEADPRTYLAAERTLLAWIRTGLAMMGFGFVVARFGLFLREMLAARNQLPVHQGRFSLSIGVALVLLGVATTGLAALRHRQVVRRLSAGQPIGDSLLPVLFAAILAAAGVAMAVYLVLAQK
jgi:putative membrane protein